MPNHLLCLATRKGLEVVRAAIAEIAPRTLVVCAFREVNVAESFDEQIRQTAAASGILSVEWPQFRDDPIGFMRNRDITSALCVGWRYLFPPEAVEHLKGNVVV